MRGSQHNHAGHGEHPWALLGLLPIVAVLVLALKDARHQPHPPAATQVAAAALPAAHGAGEGCARAPGQSVARPAPRAYRETDTMAAMVGQRGERVVSYGLPWELAAGIALGHCPQGRAGRV